MQHKRLYIKVKKLNYLHLNDIHSNLSHVYVGIICIAVNIVFSYNKLADYTIIKQKKKWDYDRALRNTMGWIYLI